MAINRFNKFTPRDYSMEWYVPKEYTPNFEAWDSALGAMQKNYDATTALMSQKKPKYLQTEEDRALYQQYTSLVNQGLDDISKTFQEKGAIQGQKAMKDNLRKIMDQWQPGGSAAVLEDRYTSYAEARKNIEETFKDDPRGINKQYALSKLEEQFKKPLSYNPQTGEYTRITTPELLKDPNLQKLIFDAAKEIEESGTTSILQRDAAWFEIVKQKGKPEEKLKMIADAVMEQYPQQMAVESWNRKRFLDESSARTAYEKEVNAGLEGTKKTIAGAKSMGKDDLEKLQSELIQAGLDVKMTGKYDDQTKKALDQYMKSQESLAKQNIQNFNYDNYIARDVRETNRDYARAFASNFIDRDLEYNKAWEFQQKMAFERQKSERFLSAIERLVADKAGTEMATPGRALQMPEFNRLQEESKANLSQASKSVEQVLNGTVGQVLGTDKNRLNEWMNAYNGSGRNIDKFKELAKKNPQFAGMSDNDLVKAFSTITQNDGLISGAYNGYRMAKDTYDRLGQTQITISTAYANTDDGKKHLQRYQTYFPKKQGESDQDYIAAMSSDPERFKLKYDPVAEKELSRIGKKEYMQKYGKLPITWSVFHQVGMSDFNKSAQNFARKNPDKVAGSLNTYDISSLNNSRAMGSVKSIIEQDISSGSTNGYVSEGRQGLVWRNKDNDEVNPEGLSNVNVSINTGGLNGISYKITAKGKDGKYYTAYTDNIPSTHRDIVRNSLTSVKANAVNNNDNQLNGVTTLALSNLDNSTNWSLATSANQTRLHSGNTSDLLFYVPDMNGNQFNQMRFKGLNVGTEPVVINGKSYNYDIYKVFDPNQPGSEKFVYTLGDKLISGNNQIGFNTMDDVLLEIADKKQRAGMKTELTSNKLPTGTTLSPDQYETLILSGQDFLNGN